MALAKPVLQVRKQAKDPLALDTNWGAQVSWPRALSYACCSAGMAKWGAAFSQGIWG